MPLEDQKPYDPMKYHTPLAALLLIMLWAPPANGQPSPFMEASVQDVQQQAAAESKLYFLLFTADYVMTCDWMEAETFTNPELLSYLDQSYLGLRADINQPAGKALQQQYEVTQLPSVLVFSCRGQLLARHTGAIPAEELLAKLKAHDRPAFRQPIKAAAAKADLLPSPQPILSLSMPRLVPDVPRATTVSSAPPKAKPASRSYANYYSVQLGVFGSRANAEQARAMMQAKCSESVNIIAGQSSGTPIYRLLSGHYYDKEQARGYQRRLQAAGIDSFVKQLQQ
jgi:thioredoxin-related protein